MYIYIWVNPCSITCCGWSHSPPRRCGYRADDLTVYILIYRYLCVYLYVHTCIHIHIYKYVCMYVCTYIYIHIYIYILVPFTTEAVRLQGGRFDGV